jgi:hypothetical protein
MTEENVRLINSLKEKVLILQNSAVKYRASNALLEDRLANQKTSLDECLEKKKVLEDKYNALKIAKSFGNSEERKEKLLRQIDAMVREIDESIELIDE